MKKKRAAKRTYCFVPGCTNKPVLDRHEGYGRCPEHRFVKQNGVQGQGISKK